MGSAPEVTAKVYGPAPLSAVSTGARPSVQCNSYCSGVIATVRFPQPVLHFPEARASKMARSSSSVRALHPDIAFTRDLLVLRRGSRISERLDEDYANGKKRYYSVDSSEVVAVHECKSLNPFPELLVSFISFVAAAHEYFDSAGGRITFHEEGRHLAPTLFVGGSARGIHLRMIRAMRSVLPINVIVGVHSGTENLFGRDAHVRRFDFVDATATSSAGGDHRALD